MSDEDDGDDVDEEGDDVGAGINGSNDGGTGGFVDNQWLISILLKREKRQKKWPNYECRIFDNLMNFFSAKLVQIILF